MNKTIDAGRLVSWISDWQFSEQDNKRLYDVLETILSSIEKMPSCGAEMKWNPVKESLPKEAGDYICTCRWDKDEPFRVDVLEYGSPVNKHWAGSDRVFSNGYAFGENWGTGDESEMDNIEEVIAWMPLPDPFI